MTEMLKVALSIHNPVSCFNILFILHNNWDLYLFLFQVRWETCSFWESNRRDGCCQENGGELLAPELFTFIAKCHSSGFLTLRIPLPNVLIFIIHNDYDHNTQVRFKFGKYTFYANIMPPMLKLSTNYGLFNFFSRNFR